MLIGYHIYTFNYVTGKTWVFFFFFYLSLYISHAHLLLSLMCALGLIIWFISSFFLCWDWALVVLVHPTCMAMAIKSKYRYIRYNEAKKIVFYLCTWSFYLDKLMGNYHNVVTWCKHKRESLKKTSSHD